MKKLSPTTIGLLFVVLCTVIISYGGKGCLWWNSSNELTITGSSAALIAPSNLVITATSGTQVNLSWQDNSPYADGFKIERKSWASGDYEEINIVSSNTINYPDTVLPATTYFYRVRAYKGDANGSYSDEICVITPVDSGREVGQNSIKVGTDGKIRISYYDKTNGDLDYATISPTIGGDTIVITTVLDSIGDVGQFSSLVLDTGNTGYISYYDVSNGDLKVTSTSTSWTFAGKIDGTGTTVGLYTSIARDSSNKLHISYYDATNADLKYATNAPGYWATTTIDDPMSPDTTSTGLYSSIAVATDGTAYISYYDATLHNICYASTVPAITYTIETVITRDTSIALDSGNNLHISYYDTTNGNLKYATNASGGWVSTPIDSIGDVGQYTSIAVDTNGKVYISYYDVTNKWLKYYTNR
jgi:hypothetical protein